MRAIIIGAGRGQRLMPTTADAPKCYAEIGGRRILDWTLAALEDNGITDICFIGGYRIGAVQRDYPRLRFCHNTAWETNNILASLMYAEDLMTEPFVCCYSDTLFTTDAVGRLLGSDADIALLVDTRWAERYEHRTEHPPTDAEKVTRSGRTITRVHRDIDPAAADGEFTGVARFSTDGASQLREHYHRRRERYAGQPFREAPVFEKAYLIHLLQDMIEAGVEMSSVDTPGGYWEIDTQQDFDHARAAWGKDE